MMPKRQRRRLARSELWLQLAMSAERWAGELSEEGGTRPVSEWPADDALVALMRTYRLSPADLAQECRRLGDELEARALRAGYDDHLDDPMQRSR